MPDDPFLGGLMFGMQMAERRRARKDEMEFEKQKFDSLMILKKQEDEREAKQAEFRLKSEQQEFDQRQQLFGLQKQQTEQQVQAGAQKLQEEDTARKFGLLEMRARSRARRSLLERSQDPMAKEQLDILGEQDKLLEQEYRKASQPPAEAAPSQVAPVAPQAFEGEGPPITDESAGGSPMQPSGSSGQLPGGADRKSLLTGMRDQQGPRGAASDTQAERMPTFRMDQSGGLTPSGQQGAQPDTAAWYRDIANAPAGSMKTTATGQTFRVYETDAEAKRAQKELDQMKESAGMPNYDPGYAIISKEGAAKQATQLEQQKMQEAVTSAQLEQQADVSKMARERPATQMAFNQFGSPTQLMPDGTVQGVSVKTIARDRSALEKLFSEGKGSKALLGSYNQAVAKAIQDAAGATAQDGAPNTLNASLQEAEPGYLRINRIKIDDASASTIQQLRGVNDFLRANGERPLLEIREPTPAEVMQDYQAALPDEFKFRKVPGVVGAQFGGITPAGIARPPHLLLQGELGTETRAKLEMAESKLSAALARSIQENRDSPQLGQSINEAKNALASIRGQYAIGKAPEIESILKSGEKIAAKGAAAVPAAPSEPQGPPQRSTAVNPLPQPRKARGAGVGAGPSGFLRMGATMAAMGSAQDVTDANKAIGSITKASAKEKAQTIKDKSDEVKTAWAGASKEERKGILASWTQARSKILADQKDFPVATLKLIDDIVGWKGK